MEKHKTSNYNPPVLSEKKDLTFIKSIDLIVKVLQAKPSPCHVETPQTFKTTYDFYRDSTKIQDEVIL